MKVTLDFHGFTQARSLPGRWRRGDRVSVPLRMLLSGAGGGEDDIIEGFEDMYDVMSDDCRQCNAEEWFVLVRPKCGER